MPKKQNTKEKKEYKYPKEEKKSKLSQTKKKKSKSKKNKKKNWKQYLEENKIEDIKFEIKRDKLNKKSEINNIKLENNFENNNSEQINSSSEINKADGGFVNQNINNKNMKIGFIDENNGNSNQINNKDTLKEIKEDYNVEKIDSNNEWTNILLNTLKNYSSEISSENSNSTNNKQVLNEEDIKLNSDSDSNLPEDIDDLETKIKEENAQKKLNND